MRRSRSCGPEKRTSSTTSIARITTTGSRPGWIRGAPRWPGPTGSSARRSLRAICHPPSRTESISTRWTGPSSCSTTFPRSRSSTCATRSRCSTRASGGVGVTHNNFVVESFIDELAAVSKQDPVAFRRALLRKSPRALTVLELAAKEAGWGKPVPRGRGRGVALLFSSWGTYLAQVAEVEVTGSSDVRVRRIVCAVDCGQVVNPDIVKAQIESGVVYGISGALWGEVTLNNGRVEQSNFNNYRVLRMNETPPIDVRLVRNSEAPGGIGEPGTSVTAAALANAVYAATGKRLRKLPLQPGLASSTR